MRLLVFGAELVSYSLIEERSSEGWGDGQFKKSWARSEAFWVATDRFDALWPSQWGEPMAEGNTSRAIPRALAEAIEPWASLALRSAREAIADRFPKDMGDQGLLCWGSEPSAAIPAMLCASLAPTAFLLPTPPNAPPAAKDAAVTPIASDFQKALLAALSAQFGGPAGRVFTAEETRTHNKGGLRDPAFHLALARSHWVQFLSMPTFVSHAGHSPEQHDNILREPLARVLDFLAIDQEARAASPDSSFSALRRIARL